MENNGELVLTLMDLGMCLLEHKPSVPTDDSSSATMAKLEKQERQTHFSLMIIETHHPK